MDAQRIPHRRGLGSLKLSHMANIEYLVLGL